jgi:hypothetical protein
MVEKNAREPGSSLMMADAATGTGKGILSLFFLFFLL